MATDKPYPIALNVVKHSIVHFFRKNKEQITPAESQTCLQLVLRLDQVRRTVSHCAQCVTREFKMKKIWRSRKGNIGAKFVINASKQKISLICTCLIIMDLSVPFVQLY